MPPLSVATRLLGPVHPGAFRLFLAMLVFGSHFSSFAIGAFAVYVFFVLSGFWLQRMWTERYVNAHAPYLTYMVSRLWRLGPVMALISVITTPVLLALGAIDAGVLIGDAPHLLFSSLFLLGYSWLDYLPVGSAWSLDVEMQFYILAPLLSLLARGWRSRLALLALAAGCSFAFSSNHLTPMLPKYIVFFMIGMAAAQVDWRPSRAMAAGSATIVALLAAAVLISPWRGILLVGAHPGPLARYTLTCNVVLAAIAIPFAIYTTRQRSDATDRMMADLSYIVYLLHWVAMQWFFTIPGSFAHRLPYALAAFVVVPPVSWLIWRYYDRPVNHARSAWVAARIATRAARATQTARVEAEVSAP